MMNNNKAKSIGSKCQATHQPLNLPANGHCDHQLPSQAREAICLACIALEVSGLGKFGRLARQDWLGRTAFCKKCLPTL